MEKDKHVIWNNDSIAHDGQEACIKEDWIGEVQAALGLCESNDIPIPSGLVDAVKEAAIDDAIANAMENHEETINFIQAYRDFADEENIGAIIDDRFEDELAERADMNVKDWLGDEIGNLSGIDVHGSIPFIKDDDGYCVLNYYRRYHPYDPIGNAGNLLETLYKKMGGDAIELSVKGGELVASESVGYVGEMEDHIVKLVDKDFVKEIERLFGDGPDKFLRDNGFDKNAVLDDVVVALAEKHGCLQDIVPAICEVYGWPVGDGQSQEAGESLDEICDAKSAEAEFDYGVCGDVLGEQERG